MEKEEKEIITPDKKKRVNVAGVVHVLLFHNYIVFLSAIVLGVLLDGVSPHNLLSGRIYQDIGIVMIIIGSFFVYWAQSSTTHSKNRPGDQRDVHFFLNGPYKYTRNPTNFGITFMSLGLGFLLNSPIAIGLVFIAYLISRFIFIKKQDHLLFEKYGDIFNDYKKRVKDWI